MDNKLNHRIHLNGANIVIYSAYNEYAPWTLYALRFTFCDMSVLKPDIEKYFRSLPEWGIDDCYTKALREFSTAYDFELTSSSEEAVAVFSRHTSSPSPSPSPSHDPEDDADTLGVCCEAIDLIAEEGILYCGTCGKSHGKLLQLTSNTKLVSKNNESLEQTGMPINPHLPKSSMGTTIGWSRKASHNKMRRYHNWSVMPSKERSLYVVYKYISTMCNRDGTQLPLKVQSTAKTMYQKISENYTTRGAKRKGLIAACVYYASKKEGATREPREIAELFSISTKDLSTGIRCFQQQAVWLDTGLYSREESSIPKDYIGRYLTKLMIHDTSIMLLAEGMANRVQELHVCGHATPTSVAAAILFSLIQLLSMNITAKDIADAVGVSTITIQKCSHQIMENITMILPPEILSKLQ
jgi:transcription initiation factor TFIIIB Brf1 subunit/transcription initiation factor TFIIB